MENNMHNIQAENQKCFDVLEKIKKYYIEDGLDIYSVVASYIFDVPYDDCVMDQCSLTNQVRRDFAKKLLLANKSFDEIYDNICDNLYYNKEELKRLIRKRFPYSKCLSYDDERTFDDKFIDSCTFIASILGYCRMCDYIHTNKSISQSCNGQGCKSDLF